MKKFLAIAALLLTLTSCSLWNKEEAKEEPKTESHTEAKPLTGLVSLNYVLHVDSPTGKVVDTNLENIAKANGLDKTGSVYKPFEFTFGKSEVVPGFERGVLTMKKGEKKIIEVLPKDGYGEAVLEENVPKYQIAPQFTITTDKRNFSDKNTETVPLSTFGEEGKTFTVGKTLTGGDNITAKITKIENDMVTLDVDNKSNPFYGKRVVVGATAEKDKTKFTVKGLTETGITLDVENAESPFYGKEFVAGATATLKNGSTLTVKSFSGETVNISLPNPSTHPLVGKTLYFEVEVLDLR